MVKLSKDRILSITNSFEKKKIAIIGDLMLDQYLWGSANRISPEAPVPIVDIIEESNRLGGSANVANNINSLSGIAYPIGIIGDDTNGSLLLDLMNDEHFNKDGIIRDSGIPTTIKTRVIANQQHVVRIDHENKHTVSDASRNKLIDYVNQNIKTFDAVIIEDYNKGVITKELIQEVIKIALKYDIPVAVDPKFNNFFEFKNIMVFKPNQKEVEEATGIKITDEGSLLNIMKIILERLNCSNILLTQGKEGMALMEKSGELTFINTRARKVADVSGAGDTVITVASLLLSLNASLAEIAYISNIAGGLVCEKVGVVPIFKEDLINELTSGGF
jgi:rfaE bifunctional protein kinase chain/domain